VLGFTDPEAMLDTMTPEQWQHWQAVDCVEPVGNRGCEIILARIGELLAGFVGAEMRAADFAPWLAPSNGGKLTPKQSAAAIGQHLQAIARR